MKKNLKAYKLCPGRAACLVALLMLPCSMLYALEKVATGNRDQSVRLTLEANLKITEARVAALQAKIDAMNACYARKMLYTPTGCVAIPQQQKACACVR